MKTLFLILFLAVVWLDCRAQLITSNLVGRWKGGNWHVNADYTIDTWYDSHNTDCTVNPDGLTNNLTQATTINMPLATNLWNGLPAAVFRGQQYSPHGGSTNFMSVGSALVSHSNTNSVYYVMTGPVSQSQPMCVWEFTSWPFPWLLWTPQPLTANRNPPQGETFINKNFTLYPPLNVAVFSQSAGKSSTIIGWNHSQQTGAALAASALNSGEIGGYSLGNYWGGYIQDLLIYNQAHTSAQMDQMVTALASMWMVQTNFVKQVVCRGDSITEGAHSTNQMSWPMQAYWQNPEHAWYNYGVSSSKISTNTVSGDNTWFWRDTNFVDSAFQTLYTTHTLLAMGGVNDINSDGLTGSETWMRLTNWAKARIDQKGWSLTPITPPSENSGPGYTVILDYANAIRTFTNGVWGGLIVDCGVGSVYDTRLSNASNTAYFYSDGLHLVNAGYYVVAQHAWQAVNQGRRQVGFRLP